MVEYSNKNKSLLKSFLKKLDKLTGFFFGDIARSLTNINNPKYWDNYFSKYNDFYRDFPYKFLLDFFPKNEKFTLLDIGCGLGDGCRLIKKNFPEAEIEGADFSPVSINKAKSICAGINYFLLDLKKDEPRHKYDFISLVHILEHFDNPFKILDKCLKFANKAVIIMVPLSEKFDSPRLYSRGEHRYLFNQDTFSKYDCRVLKITEYIPSAGYKYIVFEIKPRLDNK